MPKILIVDDSTTMRKALRSCLESDGYQFFEAADGVEGLKAFNDNRDVALVLTDVNMPNMDGLTMVERLRQEEHGKSVVIMVVSTEGSVELKSRAKSSGVIAWMTKPPQPEKLREAVKIVMKHQVK